MSEPMLFLLLTYSQCLGLGFRNVEEDAVGRSWEGQLKTEGWRKKKENHVILKRQWGFKNENQK